MKIKDIKIMIKETIDAESIFLAKPSLLAEANIGRVKRRIEEEGIPFAMLTAFRGEYGRQENKDRNWELKQSLDNAGLSYTQMAGSGYKGKDEEVVVEDSVLVWDEPRGDKYRTAEKVFDIARRLASEFHQESFVYGGPKPGEEDSNYSIHLYTSDGDIIDEVWAGGPEGYDELVVRDDAAEYWSKRDTFFFNSAFNSTNVCFC